MLYVNIESQDEQRKVFMILAVGKHLLLPAHHYLYAEEACMLG